MCLFLTQSFSHFGFLPALRPRFSMCALHPLYQAWPVFAALPLAAAPAAAAITALATFACDRGLIFVQRPSWAQTRTAQVWN